MTACAVATTGRRTGFALRRFSGVLRKTAQAPPEVSNGVARRAGSALTLAALQVVDSVCRVAGEDKARNDHEGRYREARLCACGRGHTEHE